MLVSPAAAARLAAVTLPRLAAVTLPRLAPPIPMPRPIVALAVIAARPLAGVAESSIGALTSAGAVS